MSGSRDRGCFHLNGKSGMNNAGDGDPGDKMKDQICAKQEENSLRLDDPFL